MKKLIYYLCIMTWMVIVPTSCKDDDNEDDIQPQPELLLTKIDWNGITLVELMYDTEKKLTRTNYYSFTGQLSLYTLYEYDDKGIKESRRYKADHSLNYRTVYTLDNFGRAIKGENYSDTNEFEELFSVSSYSYDPTGQLSVKQFGLPGDPIYSREEFNYGAPHHRISAQTTYYPKQPNEYVGLLIDYTMGDRTIPAHWNEYVFLLGVSGLDEFIWEMFNTTNEIKLWDNDEELYIHYTNEASEHQFNSEGYLIRQVLTRKNLLNQAESVREMTYEYTQ